MDLFTTRTSPCHVCTAHTLLSNSTTAAEPSRIDVMVAFNHIDQIIIIWF